MPELRRCPFCGSAAKLERGLFLWAVVCKCGSHVFYGCESSELWTADAWNRRAGEDA